MGLKINQQAPNFTLPSTSGDLFELHKDAKYSACIIYFYPKDFTRVCTAEACEFRNAFDVFAKMDIPVFGISRDDMATHLHFKDKNKLPFELLSDEDGEVCKLYKAIIPVVGMTKRVTYLIDRKHQIRAVYENLFSAEKHINSMIEILKAEEIS